MRIAAITTLFVVLLAAGTLSYAADLKPFKGWVQSTGEGVPIDPLDYPFLAEMIALYGMPSPVMPPVLSTYEGTNNVGGKSLHENAQMFYFFPLDPYWSRFVMIFFEDSTITASNGDKMFARIEGVYYSSINKFIDKWIITDGTGSFDGAEGEVIAREVIERDGEALTVYEGYIKTIGKSKKE